MRYIRKIRSVSACDYGWYRVTGTKANPVLVPVAVWAVISVATASADESPEYVERDKIVGFTAGEIGIDVPEPELLESAAGYVRIDDVLLSEVDRNPHILPQENLVWED